MARKEQLYICIGLLMATLPTVINNWLKMPDFFRGTLIGLGIGLEIIGLVMIIKRKKENQDAADF